ncbi:hypothetical protein IAU59_001647 [Kwoniella sp. CBS 9459]
MPSSVGRKSRSSLLDIAVLADLPPGSYHSDDERDEHEDDDGEGAESDSSVQAYDEPPDYLKRNTNKGNPIVVESSEDEDDDKPLFPADNPASSGSTETSSDVDELEEQPGPSRRSMGKRSRRASGARGSRTVRRGDDPSGRESKRRKRSTFVPEPPPPNLQPIAGVVSALVEPPVALPPKLAIPAQLDPLAVVLEILPDIDIGWALANIEAEVAGGRGDNASNRVIEMAFEMDGGYPKASSRGKGKSKEKETAPGEDGAAEEYKSVLYRNDTRLGAAYVKNSIQQLEEDFPRVPLPFIRTAFYGNDYKYVPAYDSLQNEVKKAAKSYTELKRPRAIGAGRSRGAASNQVASQESSAADDSSLAAFMAELAWLQEVKAKQRREKDEEEARKLAHEDALANGGGIECGCCFGEEVWEDTFQCAEGHLFCRECVTKHVETKLGEERTVILCMDMSICKAVFPDSELDRLLSAKSLALYHRLKQADEIEQAGIEGLETCPNCPFAAVIDNPHEKLFRCMNEECGQVTCRACRRKDHIPKTCAEVEADLKLNNRHTVEDAMSEALIRKCPKCAKPYIKDSGCNKIYCSKCHTMSCYICQKQIQGYDHFDQNPANYKAGKTAGKCALWDPSQEQNDVNAIRDARDNARIRVRAAALANGVNLDENDLNVDLPGAHGAPPGPAGLAAIPPYMGRPAPVVGAALFPANPVNMVAPRPRAHAGAGQLYRPNAFQPNHPRPPPFPAHRYLRAGDPPPEDENDDDLISNRYNPPPILDAQGLGYRYQPAPYVPPPAPPGYYYG